MKKTSKKQLSNILFVLFIALLIIPQTRKPIHVLFSKGLAMFSPTIIDEKDRVTLNTYNWVLRSETGEEFDFNTVKNKIVIINFWATWCPPCIAEMESLENLYQDYKVNNQIEFLFITNDSFEKTSLFKEKYGYLFPVYNPISLTPSAINSSSLPTTYIIDYNGNIVVNKTGAANWNSESIHNLIKKMLLKEE